MTRSPVARGLPDQTQYPLPRVEVVQFAEAITLPHIAGGSGRRPGEGPILHPLRASGPTLPGGE